MTDAPPVRVTAPADLFTTDELKAHCRVDIDDPVLASMAAAAVAHLDGYNGLVGRCLVTQTWRQAYGTIARCLRLPMPATAIERVTLTGRAGDEQDIDDDRYRLVQDIHGSLVKLAADFVLPTDLDDDEAVTVTFTAGYGGPADVPTPIRHAVLLLVGAWYENREQTAIGVSVADLPMSVSVETLIAPYRRWSI